MSQYVTFQGKNCNSHPVHVVQPCLLLMLQDQVCSTNVQHSSKPIAEWYNLRTHLTDFNLGVTTSPKEKKGLCSVASVHCVHWTSDFSNFSLSDSSIRFAYKCLMYEHHVMAKVDSHSNVAHQIGWRENLQGKLKCYSQYWGLPRQRFPSSDGSWGFCFHLAAGNSGHRKVYLISGRSASWRCSPKHSGSCNSALAPKDWKKT